MYYLYYRKKPYRTPQHFCQFWSKTWKGNKRHVNLPMNKLKHIFPHQIRTLYNSLIHPHLIYGLYIWGFSPKRLTILQKKAVRIFARRPYISHTTSIFKDFKILKLKTNILFSSTSCTTKILIIFFLHILTILPLTMMLKITMI